MCVLGGTRLPGGCCFAWGGRWRFGRRPASRDLPAEVVGVADCRTCAVPCTARMMRRTLRHGGRRTPYALPGRTWWPWCFVCFSSAGHRPVSDARALQVSPRLLSNFGILYASYKAAVLSSGRPGGDEASVVRMMGEVCALVMQQLHRPHRFAPHHRRVTQPYDYYDFGQRYMR